MLTVLWHSLLKLVVITSAWTYFLFLGSFLRSWLHGHFLIWMLEYRLYFNQTFPIFKKVPLFLSKELNFIHQNTAFIHKITSQTIHKIWLPEYNKDTLSWHQTRATHQLKVSLRLLQFWSQINSKLLILSEWTTACSDLVNLRKWVPIGSVSYRIFCCCNLI